MKQADAGSIGRTFTGLALLFVFQDRSWSLWDAWWFRGLLVVALVAGLLAGYRLRGSAIRRRSRDLAAQVSERTLQLALQTADLEALYEADEQLDRSERLDDVLQALVDMAVNRLGADKSAVLCLDERQERLEIRVACGFSSGFRSLFSVAPHEGVTGHVMQTGEPVLVEDAVTDPRRAAEPPATAEAALREGVRSFMHLPIRLEDGVFGVFNISYTHPHAFSERDQRLFSALAHRASIAIESARHFDRERRRADQFRQIAEVGRRVTSVLDTEEVLVQVARLVQQAFGYYHVGIGLIEGDQVVYRVGAGELWHNPHFQYSPPRLKVGAEGLSGWVAATGEPVCIPDVSREPRYVWMEGSRTRSELVVPMLANQRVIGVIDAQSDRLSAFDEGDQAMLELLANQAATAIENARLYEEAQRRVAELTSLQQTARAVASTLELDKLLNLIIAQATKLLQADGGLINLVAPDAREDEVVAVAGLAASLLGQRGPLASSLSGWVTLNNQPVVSNDVQQDSRVEHGSLPWLEGEGIQSAILAPLSIKDQVIGSIVLIGTGEARREFGHADLDLLIAFADQAAVAIDNARLYERGQELAAMRERSRLARELHDAVTQNLFSASLIAEILPGTWAADPAEGQQLLVQLRQLSRGALAEMRTLLLELRPAALAEAKLVDLLRQLAEAVSGRTGLPVALNVDTACELPFEVRVALYRVAQEALNNVVKHAQAHRVAVDLACLPAEAGLQQVQGPGPSVLSAPGVRLCITDDGCGFDVDAVSAEHLGLRIIRERAQSIGAAAEVRSSPGCGTQVAVTWNIDRAPALAPGPAEGQSRPGANRMGQAAPESAR